MRDYLESNISFSKNDYESIKNFGKYKEFLITRYKTYNEDFCRFYKKGIIHSKEKLEFQFILYLLYKLTADSDKFSSFHSKFDETESSLVLVETDKKRNLEDSPHAVGKMTALTKKTKKPCVQFG